MPGFVKQLFWSALFGAMLAVIGGAAYRSYEILGPGYALDAVPPLRMALDVMHLDLLAAYGAAAGITLGVFGLLMNLLLRTLRRLSGRVPATEEQADADSIIRAERAQLADSYLSSLGDRSLDNVMLTPLGDDEAPEVENIVTARNGQFTYRVLAYRHLTEQERADVVREALRLGHVSEPQAGGTATVMTAIGK